MNKNILIVMAGGVIVAVLVAMLVQFGLSSGNDREVEVVEEEKVNVLVAATDLQIGDELGEGDMKWQSWPEGSIFAGAITQDDNQQPLEALEGRLSRSVSENEPMLDSALVSEEGNNFVAATLEPGFRALAIEVQAQSMAGGFITPGDYVDVLLTYQARIEPGDDPYAQKVVNENIDRFATETILENVKVLATDQTARRDEGEDVRVAKTVTLQVGATAAEQLALASQMGRLTLALRGIGDNSVSPDKSKRPVVTDVRMTEIVKQVREEFEQESGKPRNQIRIYNGPAVQETQTR